MDDILIQILISSNDVSLGNYQIELCVKSLYWYYNENFPPQFLTLRLRVTNSDAIDDGGETGETGETGDEKDKPNVVDEGNFLPGFEVPFLAVGLIVVLMITTRKRKQIKR